MSKVGIIGSGMVGQTLGRGFLELGYEVKIGSRTPEKLEQWVIEAGGGGRDNNKKASTGTFDETAAFGDLIVLAVKGHAVEEAIGLAGPKNFSGKIVMDATNPLDFSRGMPPGLLQAYATRSLGEFLQEKLSASKVVKAFNTAPSTLMLHPKIQGARMLICGNDAGAKDTVTKIVKQLGWADSIDIGGIQDAKYLEYMVVLWVKAASATNSFDSTFIFTKE